VGFVHRAYQHAFCVEMVDVPDLVVVIWITVSVEVLAPVAKIVVEKLVVDFVSAVADVLATLVAVWVAVDTEVVVIGAQVEVGKLVVAVGAVVSVLVIAVVIWVTVDVDVLVTVVKVVVDMHATSVVHFAWIPNPGRACTGLGYS